MIEVWGCHASPSSDGDFLLDFSTGCYPDLYEWVNEALKKGLTECGCAVCIMMTRTRIGRLDSGDALQCGMKGLGGLHADD